MKCSGEGLMAAAEVAPNYAVPSHRSAPGKSEVERGE